MRVDLTGADLRDAILRGAVLHLASLYGANLEGADLRDADLNGATYDAETRWPGRFQAGMIPTLGLWTRGTFCAIVGRWTGSYPPSTKGCGAPSRPLRGGWAHLWDGTARRHLTYVRDL